MSALVVIGLVRCFGAGTLLLSSIVPIVDNNHRPHTIGGV